MKEIKLVNGQIALVDDEDFEYLNQFRWHVLRKKYTSYARMDINNKAQLMHRLIMNTPPDMQTDHKDKNGLNNQRSNLRICTNGQNQSNKRRWGKHKYRGVFPMFRKARGIEYKYFQVYINHNSKYLYVGCCKSEEGAALIYNEAAIKYHGEFASLNIIE